MIATFYSFKGGVGRSMAMANVARWLQLCGLNVVAVDWDLEAPGLESFLFDDAQAEATRAQQGLLDLLLQYLEDHANLGLDSLPDRQAQQAALLEVLPPIRHLLQDVPPPVSAPNSEGGAEGGGGGSGSGVQIGRLRLLSAGCRDGDRFAEYANAVQSFDWNDFYAQRHGLAYFDWLRERLAQECDVVLIDSRTGVTEMGGVCTRQMADVVVALVAPNRQNLEGSLRMVRSFCRASLMQERMQRPLDVLMVPTRVDMSSDIKDLFDRQFSPAAAEFVPASLRSSRLRPWDLRIPYITKYAYMEKLAIGADDGDSDLQAAYKLLAAHLAWLARDDSPMFQRMQGEIERCFGADFTRVRLNAEATLQRVLGALATDDHAKVLGLLARTVLVSEDAVARDSPRQYPLELLDRPHQGLAEILLHGGLLRRAQGKRALIGLSSDDLVVAPSLKSYLDANREFLVWRQGLASACEAWTAKQRHTGALLPPSLVDEALAQRTQRPAFDLFEDEQTFIGLSATQAEALREQADLAEQTRVRQRQPGPTSADLPSPVLATATPAPMPAPEAQSSRGSGWRFAVVGAATLLGFAALLPQAFKLVMQPPAGPASAAPPPTPMPAVMAVEPQRAAAAAQSASK